jgi:hypothetical protein
MMQGLSSKIFNFPASDDIVIFTAKPSMVVEGVTFCFLTDAEVGHCLNVIFIYYTNVFSGYSTSMMTSNFVFDKT